MTVPDLFSVEGKTALVTGGTSGLGLICAEALLSAGARVMVTSRKADACEAAQEHLSAFGPCEAFVGDVGSEEGARAIADVVGDRCTRLDILINNAGTSWGASFEDFPWSAWEKVMSVNLIGAFELTRALMPLLASSARADSPSRIVNMGSVTGILPIRERAYSYSTSKAAMHHLTRMLSNEFASRHVTVNAIAPGPFETRMTAFALQGETARAHTRSAVPLGRLGAPENLVGTVLYLCGRAGAFTTGTIIPLDGGMSSAEPPGMWLVEDA